MNTTPSRTVRTLVLAGVLAVAGSTSALAAAASGTWSVRLRGTELDTTNKSDAFSALGIDFAADAVHVQSKVIPEVDISYWVTSQLVAELVLTIPQKHEVTLAGVGRLGTFKHLPPCLMGQYYFRTDGKLQPYVGLGLNLTLIMDVDLSVAGVELDLENSSVGIAAQAGFDYQLGKSGFLNFDIKKVGLRTDVLAGGSRLTTAKVDPWLISIGYAWRF